MRPAVVVLFCLVAAAACAVPIVREKAGREFQETIHLVREVKAFGESLGIQPAEALSQSTLEKPPRSMLWLWLQKRGTLALDSPVDIRLWLRFGTTKEQLPLERLFNISGYSVYFRQGNQFGDRRSVVTEDFATQSPATKAMVVLHEDLHDDANFNLPWEIEESLVTPLAKLAALEFFKHKEDEVGRQEVLTEIQKERSLAKELHAFVREAEGLFRALPLAEARRKIKQRIRSYAAYYRYYRFQISDQEEDTALEAKISHDLVYFRHFDRIVSLYETSGDLKALIEHLRRVPRDADHARVEDHLRKLKAGQGGISQQSIAP